MTDCEDDDCWGDISCAEGVVRLRSGKAYVFSTDNFGSHSDHVSMEIWSASGSVQVGSGTSQATCDWSFQSGFFDGAGKGHVGAIMYLDGGRGGFTIDSGCGTSSSAFLPSPMIWEYAGRNIFRTHSSDLYTWYAGSTTATGGSASGSFTWLWWSRELSSQTFSLD